jgi:hypothetical protein
VLLAKSPVVPHRLQSMILALSGGFLMASLVWGSVGSVYLLYGFRLKEPWSLGGGAAMVVTSYFIESWWLMSAACIAVIFGVYRCVTRSGF